jgi:hypothetical protein
LRQEKLPKEQGFPLSRCMGELPVNFIQAMRTGIQYMNSSKPSPVFLF